MKNKISIIALVGMSVAMFSAGCTSLGSVNMNTPHLSMQGEIMGQKFSLINPKDTILTGFSLAVTTNGSVVLSIASVSTIMNPTNTANTVDGMASVIHENGIAVVNGIQAASQAMTSAAASGIK